MVGLDALLQTRHLGKKSNKNLGSASTRTSSRKASSAADRLQVVLQIVSTPHCSSYARRFNGFAEPLKSITHSDLRLHLGVYRLLHLPSCSGRAARTLLNFADHFQESKMSDFEFTDVSGQTLTKEPGSING